MRGSRDSLKPKRNQRKYGRTDEHERKAMPLFSKEARIALLNSRMGFENAVIKAIDLQTTKPEDIVDEARVYFKQRWEEDKKSTKSTSGRHSHWLNSASTALSNIKSALQATALAPYAFRREIALRKYELNELERYNHRRLEQRIHEQPEVNLRALLHKLYQLLLSEDPLEMILGVAGLTGRRQTEITHSIVFGEPHAGLRHRYPTFWAHVTGFSKKRKHDKYAVRARELPLLAPRALLMKTLNEIRSHFPSDSHKEASKLYSSRISVAHAKHLRPLGLRRLHDLRKTFIHMAYAHFNERGSVLPAFASTVLGHKSPLSQRIMTYLIIRTTETPNLQEIFDLSSCGLDARKPEPHSGLAPNHNGAYFTPPVSDEDEKDEIDNESRGALQRSPEEDKPDLELLETHRIMRMQRSFDAATAAYNARHDKANPRGLSMYATPSAHNLHKNLTTVTTPDDIVTAARAFSGLLM